MAVVKNPSLKKNAIYNMAYQILTILTPLITSPYLSRTLGPEGIGTFSYSQSIANYFFLFAMLGVNNYGNRMIAQHRSNRKDLSDTFWQIYYMQMSQALLLCGLYFGFSIMFVSPEEKLIFLIQGLQIVSVFFDINWFAFGLEQFKLTTIRNTIIKFFTIISIFLFVKTADDLWKYALIVVMGTILGLIAVWPLVLSRTDFETPQISQIKKHIKPNVVLFIPYIANSVFQYMDKIMLGAMWDTSSVGFYSYAENILNVPLGLTTAICTVCMPRVSNLYSAGAEQKAGELLEKVVHYMLILNIALCCGIIAVAPRFIPLYLGQGYETTGELLQILALMLPIYGSASVLRMLYLIPYGKDRVYAGAVVAGAVVNLCGNAITIPFIGAIGACTMTLLANLTVLIIQMVATRAEKPYAQWIKKNIPYLVSGVIMIGLVKVILSFVNNPAASVMFGIIFGGIFYVVVAGFYLIKVEKDDFVMMRLQRCRKR